MKVLGIAVGLSPFVADGLQASLQGARIGPFSRTGQYFLLLVNLQ